MRHFVPWTQPARWLASAALCVLALAAAGCQGEPSLLCERVRLVWPYFNVDPSVDSSPADGLQIDLVLRSSLLPGSTGSLTVQGEEGDPVAHPEVAVADEVGNLAFSDVTVPLGRVTLHVAVESECGEAESTRTPFIWDGLGFPTCAVDIGVEPAAVEELAPLGVLRAEHDGDPETPGVQLHVSVQAGRPDMAVTLFALDVATGEQQILEQESGADLAAAFDVTLGEGAQSLRAVCSWEPGELRPSSPTLRFWVDTEAPDCALVEPTSRVTPADDLDPVADGVQFEIRGHSQAADVVGQPGSFTVQGTDLAGSAVDAGGESAATATLFLDPPLDQELTFRIADQAGNQCEDGATF